jgi:predicted NUDIX family phosphoesterase
MARLEFVWVVRRRDLFPDFSPQGFVRLTPHELETRYLEPARSRGFFVERREAESCPAWKQLIPYCLVRHEDSMLVFERLTTQGEARLHGKLSIGVGGHINPVDADEYGDLIRRAANRELSEELVGMPGADLIPLGLLNDDRDAVGAVHAGVVFGVRSRTPPSVRETDKMVGRLTPLVDLRGICQTPRQLESWSRAILDSQGWEEGF